MGYCAKVEYERRYVLLSEMVLSKAGRDTECQVEAYKEDTHREESDPWDLGK